MRHIDAEAVANKLNRDYRGPNNTAAFCAKRSCTTDGEGYWQYYISTRSACTDAIQARKSRCPISVV